MNKISICGVAVPSVCDVCVFCEKNTQEKKYEPGTSPPMITLSFQQIAAKKQGGQ